MDNGNPPLAAVSFLMQCFNEFDWWIWNLLKTMINVQINTRRTTVKSKRTQLSITLSILLKTPQLSVFLIKWKGSQFYYNKLFTAWLYDCPQCSSPLCFWIAILISYEFSTNEAYNTWIPSVDSILTLLLLLHIPQSVVADYLDTNSFYILTTKPAQIHPSHWINYIS